MQDQNIQERFDEELLLWCKAILCYCKDTQKRSTAIQTLVGDGDFDCK